MKNKIFSILFAVAVFFFIITFSIGLPIYFRPFYYAHIEAYEMVEGSGFTYEEIREAYDEVLDYLTVPCRKFGTGVMRISESGASHFEDCKVLFDLNASVLMASAIIIIAMLVFHKHGKIGRPVIGRYSAEFWAAVSAIILPIVLGGLAAIDFDKAFLIFHKIFFPGKDNWIFSYRDDEIIRVLPQEFFMNCAIFIACGVLVISLAVITKEIISIKIRKKRVSSARFFAWLEILSIYTEI